MVTCKKSDTDNLVVGRMLLVLTFESFSFVLCFPYSLIVSNSVGIVKSFLKVG